MPDSGYPNYATLDAAGRVTFDFRGHVKAQGLDLDAGDTSNPPTERRVRWLRTTNGGLVTQLYGYEDFGSDQMFSIAQGADALKQVRNILQSRSSAGNFSQLQVVENSPDPAFSGVAAQAGTGPAQSRLIIQGNGASDFVQIGNDVQGVRKIRVAGIFTGALAPIAAGGFSPAIAIPHALNSTSVIALATTAGAGFTYGGGPNGANSYNLFFFNPTAAPSGATTYACLIISTD